MQKLKDNNDWTLDPKHIYRRSILRQKAPSWAESTERMEGQYRPIWNPEGLREQWREPNDGEYWAFQKSTFTDDAKIAEEFKEFMTDPKKLGVNLRKKNNLSSLGLDGIGYLMMKVGRGPMLTHVSNLFKLCIEKAQVPRTWKRSRTVFPYKKGDVSQPENWRPITITSCVYRIFTSMISEFIQQHIHKCGRRKIFSASQKGFVMGIQGCMEHAVLTREIIAHAKRHKKNLFMVQIDFSNAFGSVPQRMIDWVMRRMGIPDTIVEPVMNIYDGCETVLSLDSGPSKPIPWTSGTVQGCPLSPVLFNICLEPLLRALERKEFVDLGFPIVIQEENKPDVEIRINTAAYADDLNIIPMF
jgi:hypothetical protein